MSLGPQLEIGAVVGGDYRVVRLLAEGGMGRVYVVDQQSTGRQRVLKVLRPGLAGDPKMRAAFVREATAGAQIASEHVVEVLAAGVDPVSDMPWLVMEYLDGEDLGALGAARGALSPGEVREIFDQLCHALGAAHAAGVVHRDLKPQNVFVARSRRAGAPLTVKLLDFGIARFVESTALRAAAAGDVTARGNTSAALGSPLWMAPEQLTLRPVSPATDVWALGLLAFWLLTGQSYWRNAHAADASVESLLAEKLFAQLDVASVRAAEYGAAARLPAGFDAWFARCLARDPAARFATASDAHAALAGVLTASPALASSAGPAMAPTAAARPLAMPVGTSVSPSRRAGYVAIAASAAVVVAAGALVARGRHVASTASSSVPSARAAAPPVGVSEAPPAAIVRTALVAPWAPPAVAPVAVSATAPSQAPGTAARAASGHAGDALGAVPRGTAARSHAAARPMTSPTSTESSVPAAIRADGVASVRRSLGGVEDRADAADREADALASSNPAGARTLRATAAELRASSDGLIASYARRGDAATDPDQAAFFRELAAEGRAYVQRRRANRHAP